MQNPILVEVKRNHVLESFHRGTVCIVNKNNEIIFSLGNPQQVSFPRSALKLIQVIPLIESGAADAFGFDDTEIALMCGSHNAEKEHLTILQRIFRKAQLDMQMLQCGVQEPREKRAIEYLRSSGAKAGQIHNNCSGKHAGFLAYCKFHDIDTHAYIDSTNQLHREIMDLVSQMAKLDKSQLTIAYDGCSAPIFAMPIYNMALMYQALTNPEKFPDKRAAAIRRVVHAVQKNPFMIAGSNRYCTQMMDLFGERIIGKTGAEGVFCMSFLKEQLGMATKIDDGKMHIQYMVAQEIIKRSALFSEELLEPLNSYISEPIKNFRNITTGELRVVSELFSGFSLA